ncbi:MAG: helix-turn-helix domain-containing protein [Oculatellaceae cyanobacterium Prado106]|jgi:transcriptional regulator with XRE-family HTH domain|nr:helix-turn-helix domain-containing protein [Oculatellaceae cyanobacterium Prado106]
MSKVQQLIRLKQCRSVVGLTQQQRSEMLHTTQQTIARWESGKTAIPSAVLKELAICLSCQIEDILGISSVKHSMYARSLKSFAQSGREQINFYGGLNLSSRNYRMRYGSTARSRFDQIALMMVPASAYEMAVYGNAAAEDEDIP